VRGVLGKKNNVSILVLVESGLQYTPKGLNTAITVGFNPCFSGIRSSIIAEKAFEYYDTGFNPCFSGIRSSMMAHVRAVAVEN